MVLDSLSKVVRTSIWAAVAVGIGVAILVVTVFVLEKVTPESCLSSMFLFGSGPRKYADDDPRLNTATFGVPVLLFSQNYAAKQAGAFDAEVTSDPFRRTLLLVHGKDTDAQFLLGLIGVPPSDTLVAAVELPGYGCRETEKATEKSCVLTVAKALRAAAQKFGPENVGVVGHSLGTTLVLLATDALRARERPGKVFLVSPFPSFRTLMQETMGLAGLMLADHVNAVPSINRLKTDNDVGRRRVEFFVLHGKHDPVISTALAKRVAEGLNARYHLVNASHSDLPVGQFVWRYF